MIVPILLGLLLIALSPSPAWANSNIVLNELLPHPSTGEEDWVELYNTSAETIDLSTFKLSDSTSVIANAFKAGDSLTPHGFFVVSLGTRLNNSGDTLNLLTNQDQTLDSYTYTSSSLDTSIGRSPDGSENWVSFPAPTKSSPNGVGNQVTPTVTISTAGLSLSEFYPYPHSGEQEWVEIYNDNVTTLSLNGFKIDDEEGGSSPVTLVDETIPPKGYFYLQFDSKLNNSGDTVRFLSPDGVLLDSFAFASATQGSSWVKKAGSWEETSTPTMGNTNQYSQALASTATPTPTKKTVTETPKKTTSSPTPSSKPTNNSEVLGEETATSSPTTATNKIKLSFEDEDEKDAKVLGESTTNYLSWGLILLGLIVVALPTIIVIRKKRG